MRTREKCLAFGGGSDSDGRMIRGGFLIEEDRKALIALARDGLAAGRVTRRANALVLLDNTKSLPMGPPPRSDRHDEPRAFN
jgi:hypothetical protein